MDSCLVTRLEYYLELTPQERDFVEKMESEPQDVQKGFVLQAPGEPCKNLFVLHDGWATVSGKASDNRIHRCRIYLPGEVVGLSEIGTAASPYHTVMQTAGTVCPFPRAAMSDMLVNYPRLSGLMLSLSAMDQIALRDHALSLAAMDAESRFKMFLLHLRARLHVANVGMGNRIRVPFSQTELSEYLGMTPVYVNRLLRGWITSADIEVERPYFRLLNRDAWEAELGFVNPFEKMDTTWFPSASQDERWD